MMCIVDRELTLTLPFVKTLQKCYVTHSIDQQLEALADQRHRVMRKVAFSSVQADYTFK